MHNPITNPYNGRYFQDILLIYREFGYDCNNRERYLKTKIDSVLRIENCLFKSSKIKQAIVLGVSER